MHERETLFKKTILDTGTRVLTEKIPHVKSVAIGFSVGAGARDETKNISGISHFLEHLLFKGTKNRTAKQISEAFDRLGGELNAFSAKESTCLYGRLLDEHIETGVEILADLVQNPILKEKDIDFEQKVILEELNLYEDTPDEKIHDLFVSSLWPDHPLGNPILGSKESIKGINAQLVRDFFKKRYLPSNIVVAVAGNVDHERLNEIIDKNIEEKDGKKLTRKEIKPETNKTVKLYRKKTEQAHLCYGFPGLAARDNDRFALSILSHILGGGMSSRLYQEIREKRGLAYNIYSYYTLYAETGLFAIYAGTNPAKLGQVVKLICQELEMITANNVTNEELERAKGHIKGQLVLSLENTTYRMTQLAKSEFDHSEIMPLEKLITRINMIDLEDIKRVAQNLIVPEKKMLVVIGPVKEEALEA